jgi:hypothetical protein
MTCPFAQAVWDAVRMQIPLKFNRSSVGNMQQCLFDFLAKASPIQATTLAITCWHIWEVRNDARNGKGTIHPPRVAGKNLAYIENIVKFCYKPSPENRRDSSSKPRWSSPPVGKVCVNVDAAIFSQEPRMGWGAVVRDHEGSMLFACHEGIAGVFSPELAEAEAIRRALVRF